ncbi:MAG: CRTAC1 family protein, partial [Pirellulales bacterium]
LSSDAWTTSCLMADLNGDGLADLYDVNYVTGEGVFERTCDSAGQPRVCQPSRFSPQLDRCWLNLGDGRFADRSAESGVDVAGGNGLGIVAADFQGTGRLSLFVANDQDANFYFINHGAAADGSPQFVESALLAGLAFDGQGKAQACMGVAAGDANGDGRLDLFVTNFYQEPNTLYLQHSAELFDDATAAAGLREPSYELLGFGTQFVDAELDGWPDLVVVNGHIDDFRQVGSPYWMRPQYFRNLGGRFVEIEGPQLGPFFTEPGLGRGLARLDFNRDGREDFVVSRLDMPAALVANNTPDAGHFLALRLVGTSSARDAIGTRVTVSVADKSWTRQLAAGDGYMASNQRQVVFGLGRTDRIDRLIVDWPGGTHQEWRQLTVDRETIAVEGREELVEVPGRRHETTD